MYDVNGRRIPPKAKVVGSGPPEDRKGYAARDVADGWDLLAGGDPKGYAGRDVADGRDLLAGGDPNGYAARDLAEGWDPDPGPSAQDSSGWAVPFRSSPVKQASKQASNPGPPPDFHRGPGALAELSVVRQRPMRQLGSLRRMQQLAASVGRRHARSSLRRMFRRPLPRRCPGSGSRLLAQQHRCDLPLSNVNRKGLVRKGFVEDPCAERQRRVQETGVLGPITRVRGWPRALPPPSEEVSGGDGA